MDDHLDSALLKQLRDSLEVQPDKPDETPESTLKALYFAAARTPISVNKSMRKSLPDLNDKAKKRLNYLVELRCAGTPLAHITRRQQFMEVEMLASPEALIPRKHTEFLGYETLAIAKSLSTERGQLTIIDVCTGSGNLILGIIAHEMKHRGYGSDISYEAINLARKNAKYLGLNKIVTFRQGDLLEPFHTEKFLGNVDIICCNPPYISSKKVSTLHHEISGYEPSLAFDGGPFGTTILTKLVHQAPEFLKANSFLCFEVGLGWELFVTRIINKSNRYREVRYFTDCYSQAGFFVVRT